MRGLRRKGYPNKIFETERRDLGFCKLAVGALLSKAVIANNPGTALARTEPGNPSIVSLGLVIAVVLFLAPCVRPANVVGGDLMVYGRFCLYRDLLLGLPAENRGTWT